MDRNRLMNQVRYIALQFRFHLQVTANWHHCRDFWYAAYIFQTRVLLRLERTMNLLCTRERERGREGRVGRGEERK